jgi:hypothetical protein
METINNNSNVRAKKRCACLPVDLISSGNQPITIMRVLSARNER